MKYGYNPELEDFNCYSYAMGIRNEWLDIKNEGYFERCFFGSRWQFLMNDGTIDELAEIFVKTDILVKFPELVIVDFKDIKKGTRLIAFKMSNDDFHFMKRFPNGHWFDKRGGDVIETIKKDYALSEVWYGDYNSKTIFLGYKEDY